MAKRKKLDINGFSESKTPDAVKDIPDVHRKTRWTKDLFATMVASDIDVVEREYTDEKELLNDRSAIALYLMRQGDKLPEFRVMKRGNKLYIIMEKGEEDD